MGAQGVQLDQTSIAQLPRRVVSYRRILTLCQDQNHERNLWLAYRVPDLYLYNSGSEFNHIKSSVNVLLESNGDLVYVIPTTIEPTFKFDLKYYPFDKQTCKIIIGSWTWHQEKVNLFYDNSELVLNFLESVSGEWQIETVKVTRNVKSYHT